MKPRYSKEPSLRFRCQTPDEHGRALRYGAYIRRMPSTIVPTRTTAAMMVSIAS